MSVSVSTPLHRAAAAGFEAGASTYAAGRPDYPEALVDWLGGALNLRRGAVVVDLGAGTGKSLPLLLKTGARVVAVEPVEAMRAALSGNFPQVEALPGTAQAIPLADGAADAIVCAQAFHWFANAAALVEIRRVLKVGGRLGLVWNVRDESVDWVAALTRIIAPFEGDTPRFGSGRWREAFPAEGFSSLEETRLAYDHVGPAEDVIVRRTLSTSFVAALPEPKRAAIAEQVRALIAATPELRRREIVSYPYRTSAFVCQKR